MIDRLSQLIKSRNFSASQFADEIGVQRSSVSHVLSGRNKPSLDFITKVILRFPDINSEWLLTGRGKMQIEENKEFQLEDEITSGQRSLELEAESYLIDETVEPKESTPVVKSGKTKAGRSKAPPGSGSVEKIVFFFKDGFFREYFPKS